VATTGGLIGRITGIKDDVSRCSPGGRPLAVLRSAVTGRHKFNEPEVDDKAS